MRWGELIPGDSLSNGEVVLTVLEVTKPSQGVTVLRMLDLKTGEKFNWSLGNAGDECKWELFPA